MERCANTNYSRVCSRHDLCFLKHQIEHQRLHGGIADHPEDNRNMATLIYRTIKPTMLKGCTGENEIKETSKTILSEVPFSPESKHIINSALNGVFNLKFT